MSTLFLFVLGILAQVTAITVTALLLISILRRSTIRHATGVIGILLVIISPLLVLALPRPSWIPRENAEFPTRSSEDSSPQTLHRTTTRREGADPASTLPSANRPTNDAPPPFAYTAPGPTVSVWPAESSVPIPLYEEQGPSDDRNVAEIPRVVPSVAEPADDEAAQNPLVPSANPQPAASSIRFSLESGLSTGFAVLLVIWVCGMVLAVWRDARRRRELRIVSHSTSSSPWTNRQPVSQDVCLRLGLKELPEIRVSELTPLPFVTGLLKPIVILPREVVQSLSTERLRDILIHECAHIVRRDSWVHLLQRIGAILYWPHPGVHWLNRQVARAREELCDNFVIERGNAAEYAETLLNLAESCGHKRMGASALGLMSPRWTLEQRIGGLLDPARDTKTRTGRVTYLVLVALFASFSLMIGGIRLATTTVLAGDDSDKPSAPTTRKLTVRGKFVDDTGKPLANVQVRFLRQKSSSEAWLTYASDTTRVIAEAKSDDQGHFTVSDAEYPVVSPYDQENLAPAPIVTAKLAGKAVVVPSLFECDFQGADSKEGPITIEFKEPIVLSSDLQTLSGTVTDADGTPVMGAKVSLVPQNERYPIPGIWTAVTDRDGRYSIRDLGAWKRPPGQTFNEPNGSSYTITEPSRRIIVEHPDHVITTGETTEVPNQVDFQFPPASHITGTVVDAATDQPAAAVVVRAKGIGLQACYQTLTDRNGRYRLPVQRDIYRVWVADENRVAEVLKNFDATVEPPKEKSADFNLTEGALIVGTVIDESTNQPFAASIESPTFVAHYGPAYIRDNTGGPVLSNQLQGGVGAHHMTMVKADGSFRLRVAPGQNTIFVARYGGDAKHAKQTVVVKAGDEKNVKFQVEFTKYEPPETDADGNVIGRTIPADPEQEMEANEFDPALEAAAVMRYNRNLEQAAAAASGGKPPRAVGRDQEIFEFLPGHIPSRVRRDSVVNRLLDQYERSTLMVQDRDRSERTIKQIVDLGPAALPDLLEELDATQDPWMIRMLGFTLRALDDRRAVPALIRAIPKSASIPIPAESRIYDPLTQRSSPTRCFSSCRDPKLHKFCRQNDAEEVISDDGPHFSYENPTGEICGALRRLTGARNGEDELLDRHQVMYVPPQQMQIRSNRVAKSWAAWWEQHQHDNFESPPLPPNEAELIAELESLGAKLFRDGSTPGRPIGCIRFEGGRGLSNDALDLVKQFKQLRELHLEGSWPNAPEFNGFDSLAELTNLRFFWLHGVVITDEGLVSIGKLKNLTKLMLNGKIKSDGTGWKELTGLTQLKVLDLHSSGVTNEVMVEIAKIESLTYLRLDWTEIDDSGIAPVGQLKNLCHLSLSGTKITNDGLRELKSLQDLVRLELRKTGITGDGLKELAQLKSLAGLDLSETSIRGRGIEDLAVLKNFASLTIDHSRVNDEGLKAISHVNSLRDLRLSDTKITDDGLKELKGMKKLTYLEVKETDVTSEGVQELKNALPNLQIRD